MTNFDLENDQKIGHFGSILGSKWPKNRSKNEVEKREAKKRDKRSPKGTPPIIEPRARRHLLGPGAPYHSMIIVKQPKTTTKLLGF